MRIKKNSNGNQYLLTEQNKWVRNFCRNNVPFLDINDTIQIKDHFVFLQNEVQNGFQRYQWVDSEQIVHPDIVIVSDGYNFKEKHKILSKLPKNITIIGVNDVLNKWENQSRNINYYVVNNPYKECMKYLPSRVKVLPKCIASPRTNYEFLKNYRGMKMKYYPVNERSYTTIGMKEVQWQIDDYRNPICAAIGLAYRFGVERLLLLCCDDSFKDSRPGAINLKNELWMYPQHEVAHGLIDGNLHWLVNQEYQNVEVCDCSSGPNYKNASYIEEENILSFFGVKKNEQTTE
jgi:hypothetical protein